MPEKKKFAPDWQVGADYRIRYMMQSGNYRWYEWEVTMKFIGYGHDKTSLLFSLRPLAGTQDMTADQVIWIDEMPKNTPPVMPKRIGLYTPMNRDAASH
jgi:hypothetical protein